MNHRDAEQYLVEYAEGVFTGKLLGDLTSHVQACSDCQEWLEAFDFLANSARQSGDGEHPDGHLIALCAVRAEEEFEADRSDLRQHLEGCGRCRREIELLRAASKQAGPVVEPSESRRMLKSARAWWWKAAAAAGFLGFAVGALVGPSARHRERPDDIRPTIASTVLAEPTSDPGLSDTEFSEAEINGERLIETDGTLRISGTKINAGAVVKIQAVRTVAFGNGFEIGPQTRVKVVVSSGGNHQ